MSTIRILLIPTIAVLALNSCAPAPTEPATATPSPIALPPTAQPATTATLAPTASPTATRHPTLTPLPTYAPYTRVPPQVEDGWQTGPLSAAGIDARKMSEMLDGIYRGAENGDTLKRADGGDKMQNIHGILIVRHGKLVFEEYFYHYSRTNWHDQASVTKSITSLLVGLAIEQGYLIGVDQLVLPFFEEYQPLPAPDERRERITIQDLLTMQHGIGCNDWERSSPTYWKKDYYSQHPDMVAWTLSLPMAFAPGEQYSYCSVTTVLLGAVLSKATEMSVQQFSKKNLFAPLGITSYAWMVTPGGWADTAGSMQMTMRDMAKLGQLTLQGGVWNGQQVIPQAWIEESVRQHVKLDFNQSWGKGYGYLWWLSDVQINGQRVHSFAASGAGGQVITVYPELDMVVVITGWNIDPDNGEPFQIMERYILPAVVKR
jgi:CubicO group peptidase (beta-lactamase class C family)